MEDQGFFVPTSQNWPLVPNAEVVNNGFEILSMGFGDIGGIDEWLVANALTTNVIANLLKTA